MDLAIPNSPVVDSPEALRYNRIKRWLGFADLALGFVFLLVLLVTGWSGQLRDFAYSGAHQNYSLAVFLYVLFLLLIGKVLGFGLEYYGFRLERNYHLSDQKLRSWLWDETKTFLLSWVLATIVVELIYWTIRFSPQNWWLIAWVVFLALFVLMAQVAPVVLFPIFYKFSPLDNEDLKARLVKLSERAGTRVRGVYEWKLSEKTKKANAALTGLGATRRIILADTLLQNYSADEIEAVLAHELGHHVHRHILKSILVQAAVTFAGFWLGSEVLRYALDHVRWFETLSDFANLPLLVLVSTALSVLLMPVLNAYSRFNERQADRYCFQSIRSVDPFVSAMNKLAEQNLAERTPSKWVENLFHSHPSISNRVAAARSWAENAARAK
jgi:Zn-dependent protease with chaperone function